MSRFSTIFDVFSRRSKPSGIQSARLPETFRKRVFLWCKQVFSNNYQSAGLIDVTYMFWIEIHRFLQYKCGNSRVSDSRYSPASPEEDAVAYLLDCPGEDFLDFLEYIFRVDCLSYVAQLNNVLVDELNDLLRIDALPFYITPFANEEVQWATGPPSRSGQGPTVIDTARYPRVVIRENDVVHAEIIKPALALLNSPKFMTANTEFLEALTDYRKGDYGDCLTKCNSAFESVLKILCKRKSWSYNENDTAGTLIQTVLDKTRLENYFKDPLTIIATLRNRLSKSHGAGPKPRKVPAHLARYAINATASAILLLVEETGVK